jgi:hypothetical protein
MPNKVQAAEIKQTKKPIPHAPASPAKIAGQLQHTQQNAATQIQPQAGLDPRLLTPDNLLQLQRTLGNRAVGKECASKFCRLTPLSYNGCNHFVLEASDAYRRLGHSLACVE